VECEYGYEWLDGECRPIVGLDRQQCGVITGGLYVESVTHRRLVHGDMCDNVSRIIMDTDGKGHHNAYEVPRALRHSVLAAVFGSIVVCFPFYLLLLRFTSVFTYAGFTCALTTSMA
jgi:hypothetical protein